jgi:hypothetical protein
MQVQDCGAQEYLDEYPDNILHTCINHTHTHTHTDTDTYPHMYYTLLDVLTEKRNSFKGKEHVCRKRHLDIAVVKCAAKTTHGSSISYCQNREAWGIGREVQMRDC